METPFTSTMYVNTHSTTKEDTAMTNMNFTVSQDHTTITWFGGRQGDLDGGTWHSSTSSQGELDTSTWFGGRQGDLDGGTWHSSSSSQGEFDTSTWFGGRQGDLDGGTWHTVSIKNDATPHSNIRNGVIP